METSRCILSGLLDAVSISGEGVDVCGRETALSHDREFFLRV